MKQTRERNQVQKSLSIRTVTIPKTVDITELKKLAQKNLRTNSTARAMIMSMPDRIPRHEYPSKAEFLLKLIRLEHDSAPK